MDKFVLTSWAIGLITNIMCFIFIGYISTLSDISQMIIFVIVACFYFSAIWGSLYSLLMRYFQKDDNAI